MAERKREGVKRMTLRIGMIGTGGISHWHGKGVGEMKNDAEIVALSDPNETNMDKFVEAFGLSSAKLYSEYKEMVEREKLDAVVICTPHTLHFEQATYALNKGCHVLIEKPMACSSAEAEQMIETAEKAGKILQVSYQRHCEPLFVYIKDAIESGVIGKLTSVTASLYQDWKQLSAGHWRQDPKLSGGGMLMDSGSHIIDSILWTTGLTPVEVKTNLHQQDTPVEIDSFTSIRFAEGAVAGINIIGYAPGWHETYAFCGTEGGLFVENGGKITLRRRQQDPIVPKLPEATTNQDKSFIDAVLGRRDVLVPGTFALKVVRLTEEIYKAGHYQPLTGLKN